MTFDQILLHCHKHPNGTYDLVPLVDLEKREVQFAWGNSLRLRMDPQTQSLAKIVGRVFTEVHPNRLDELLLLPTVHVKRTPTSGRDK